MSFTVQELTTQNKHPAANS